MRSLLDIAKADILRQAQEHRLEADLRRKEARRRPITQRASIMMHVERHIAEAANLEALAIRLLGGRAH